MTPRSFRVFKRRSLLHGKFRSIFYVSTELLYINNFIGKIRLPNSKILLLTHGSNETHLNFK